MQVRENPSKVLVYVGATRSWQHLSSITRPVNGSLPTLLGGGRVKRRPALVSQSEVPHLHGVFPFQPASPKPKQGVFRSYLESKTELWTSKGFSRAMRLFQDPLLL